ncbi:apolipoprotein Da, duplicate 1 isoform X3 [Oryzias melastigma]|uniref:Apolipoprotein D n=1 Tax=Oryzias melastigma TaxID=30732 RepID=A0A3B3DEZ9_ORYME|nr:apolipoprotein Da, duplicate 1 isoform X3 [Oryzias melastigma]
MKLNLCLRRLCRAESIRNMEFLHVVVFVLLSALVGAQVPHWGPCPEPEVQQAFSLKQFMGRWFEIAKLPAQFEKGRCIETNFTLRTDSSIRVVSSEILKGELKKIEGTGIIEDPKNPAKLGITYSYVLPYSPYWILSTDYVNQALVYSCTDVLRLFHVDFAWVLGRTRSLPEATIDKAREVFAHNNIDVTRMIPSRQLGCDKTL